MMLVYIGCVCQICTETKRLKKSLFGCNNLEFIITINLFIITNTSLWGGRASYNSFCALSGELSLNY